jgi:hypothetical protein
MGGNNDKKSTDTTNNVNTYQTLMANSLKQNQDKSTNRAYDPAEEEKDPNSLEAKKKQNEIQFSFFLAQMKAAYELRLAFENALKNRKEIEYLMAKIEEWQNELKKFWATFTNNQTKSTEQPITLDQEQINYLNRLKQKIDGLLKQINYQISWLEKFIQGKKSEITQLRQERSEKINNYAQDLSKYFSIENLSNFKDMKIIFNLHEETHQDNDNKAQKKSVIIKAFDINQMAVIFSEKLASEKVEYDNRDSGFKNEIRSYVNHKIIEAISKDLTKEEVEIQARRIIKTFDVIEDLNHIFEFIDNHMVKQDINNNYRLDNINLDISNSDIKISKSEILLIQAEDFKLYLEETREILNDTKHELENLADRNEYKPSLNLNEEFNKIKTVIDKFPHTEVMTRIQKEAAYDFDIEISDDDNFNPRP